MPSFHIHIKGQVQGVGFRPFIFNLAKKWVSLALFLMEQMVFISILM
ncbi:MAG: acylphosphatase [Saprospiraceae bacterium]|nr:acylphosphatase [Saprospiraceae bacterium]